MSTSAEAVAVAERQVERMRSQVARTVLEGADSRPAREFLVEAEMQLSAAQGRHEQEVVDAEARETAALQQAADSPVKSALAGLMARLAMVINQGPVTNMSIIPGLVSDRHVSAVRDAARVLAAAAAAEQRLADRLHAARKGQAVVERCLAAKAADRAAIVARRAGGIHEPGDAEELPLVEADREVLAAEQCRADAEVAAALGPWQAASRATGDARQNLAAVEAAAEAATLVDRAATLEAALLAVIDRLDMLSRPVRPRWRASSGLRDALRRLAIQRGEA